MIMLKVSINLLSHLNLNLKLFSILVSDPEGRLRKVCGEKSVLSFYSFNPLTINFHSDYIVSKRGFNATWTKGTEIIGGNIKSQNFPDAYENLAHQVKH